MVKYFITSGNSQTGKATIKHLKALGETDIVAGARDPAKSQADLKAAGASEVVEFDFTKPELVEKAIQGAERVLVVHGPTDFANFPKWAQTVADAAKKSGTVKVLAFTIMKIAGFESDANSKLEVARIHAAVFDILSKTGLQVVSIGPCFFFENWYSQKHSIHTGTVYGAAGDAGVPYIAADDIGATAAVALKNIEKYSGQHLPICGEIINEAGVLKEISEASGLPAKYVNITVAEFSANLQKVGIPPPLADRIASFETIKAGGIAATTKVLKDVIGREPITAKAWAKANAAAFK